MDSNLASIILRFLVSFLVLQAVTLAGCAIIYRPWRNRRVWRWALGYLLCLNSAYLFLFAPVSVPHWLWISLEYLLLVPFFIYSFICMLLAPVFIAVGALYYPAKFLSRFKPSRKTAVRAPGEVDPSFSSGRRTCLKVLASGIIYPVAASSAYGAYIGKEQLDITEKPLAFADLPSEMDGYSLVQISDIHAGPFMDRRRINGFVDVVNSLAADAVVITGDILNWGDAYVDQAVAALGNLNARHGVYAILGNHDFNCDVDRFCAQLKQVGIAVLRNRWTDIRRPGGREACCLIGIDDPRGSWYLNRDFSVLDQSMASAPPGCFKILLSHRPNIFHEAAGRGIHLTLSGHTHGGQVILPFPSGHGLSLARMAYELDYGLYRSEDSLLYINRGLGIVGPPVRINCPREITRFVLTKGKREKPAV